MRKNVTIKTEHLAELIDMTANAKTEAGRALHSWLIKERDRRIHSGQLGGRPKRCVRIDSL